MIVLIDNYDSFTYNIYQYIMHFTPEITVLKNTQNIDELKSIKGISKIVLSPGPSKPQNSYLTLDAIDFYKNRLPILGVCLGMQAIGYYFGATIEKAENIMHGKIDIINHTESTIFKEIPNKFKAVRYHSLVVRNPKNMNITAKSEKDGEIMAIENDNLKIYGVQFHPESYLTDNGLKIIKNFLEVDDD